MHQPCWNERALLSRVHTDGLSLFEKKEGRQRAARLDAARRHELRRFKDVQGREVAVVAFTEVLAGAAADAGRSFVVLERRTQAPCHPIRLGFPESQYLKCLVLRNRTA